MGSLPHWQAYLCGNQERASDRNKREREREGDGERDRERHTEREQGEKERGKYGQKVITINEGRRVSLYEKSESDSREVWEL